MAYTIGSDDLISEARSGDLISCDLREQHIHRDNVPRKLPMTACVHHAHTAGAKTLHDLVSSIDDSPRLKV